MSPKRSRPISAEQLDIIKRVGERLKKMREETKLSVEQFCMQNQIPRITYGNLENGKTSFQISTLLTVLEVYDMDLVTFFKKI